MDTRRTISLMLIRQELKAARIFNTVTGRTWIFSDHPHLCSRYIRILDERWLSYNCNLILPQWVQENA